MKFTCFVFCFSCTNTIKSKYDENTTSVNGKLNDSSRYGFLIELVNPSVQEFGGEWTAAKQFNLKVGQFKSLFYFSHFVILYSPLSV